ELCPLLEFCTKAFLDDPRYREDLRYLRIWLRYVSLLLCLLLEAKRIGQTHSLFYEAYAMILELRGDITKANQIYELGISRHAQPVEQLEKMHASFLKRKFKTSRPSEMDFNIFVDDAFCDDRRDRKSEFVDPWDETLVADLLKKLAPPLQTYKGFHCSSKKYSGGVSLSSLKANARNKTVELGTVLFVALVTKIFLSV
ncbi:hypothetical protein SELMODRAFT_134310, partial [Selaginella moellendorffii]